MHDKVGPLSHVVSETCPDNSDSRKSSEDSDRHSNAASVPPATSYNQEIHNRVKFFRPFETDGSDTNNSRPPCIITSSRQQFMDTELNANTSYSGNTYSLTSQINETDDCTRSSHATINRIRSVHQTSLTDAMSASYHGDSNTNRIAQEDATSANKRKTSSLFHPQCQCSSQQSQETSLTNRHAGCSAMCHTRDGRLPVRMTFRLQDNLGTCVSVSEHRDNLETCVSVSEHRDNLEICVSVSEHWDNLGTCDSINEHQVNLGTCDSISEHQDNLGTCDSISEQHTALQSEAKERSHTFYFGAGHESYRERPQDGNHVKLCSDSSPPRQWIYDTLDFPNSGASVAEHDPDNTATLREDRHVSEDASYEGVHIRDRTVCNMTDLLEERGQVQASLLSGNNTMSERMKVPPTDSSQYVSALADTGIDDSSRNKVTTSDDDTNETLDGFEPDNVRGRKQKRTQFSPKQLIELERLFSVNMYPDFPTRHEMATRIRLSEFRVMVWFRNRRARHRKKARSSRQHRPQSPTMGHVRHPMGPLFTRTEPYLSRVFQGNGMARMPFIPPHMFSIPLMASSSRQPHAGSSLGISVLPCISTFTAGGSYRPHVIGVSQYNTLHGMPPLGLPSGVSDRPMSSLPASRETNVLQP